MQDYSIFGEFQTERQNLAKRNGDKNFKKETLKSLPAKTTVLSFTEFRE